MSDYIEPTQTQFNSAEDALKDVMSTAYPKLNTKAGSVIRELVLRPLAYIYSWLSASVTSTLTNSSLAYLKTSNATENATADDVAANYFVTRAEGTHAKGVITVTCSESILSVEAGSRFVVNDVELITEQRVVAMSGTTYEEKDDTLYVPMTLCDGYYYANIPVIAVDTGKLEIEAGAEATIDFANSSIVECVLSSAVTGGTDTDTDAVLVEKAKYNTAESGIGSYYGMRKKMTSAPVYVYGIGVVSGEDEPLFDARYNSVNINPGGYVDCYVKTQTQPSLADIEGTATKSSTGKYVVTLQSTDTAGAFTVTEVVAGGYGVSDYTMTFGTSDSYGTAKGSRFGVNQTIIVSFADDRLTGETVDTVCTVSYMPGVYQLQEYMDQDTNRFIGQNTRVKAAVPVTLRLDCVAASVSTISDDVMTALKQTICDTVSAIPVGTRILNFSDIRKACAAAFSDIDLRLPCTISASMVMMNGSIDHMYSNTGLMDIGAKTNSDTVNYALCFFSLIPDNIRIEKI